jgi:hypothetical protein
VDLLSILRGKERIPDERDWLTWGQSTVLKFPLTTKQTIVSPQLVHAKRLPPTTWTVLTAFMFSTTRADFLLAQNLGMGVKYTVGVGQVQVPISRTFGFAGGQTFSDVVALPYPPPAGATPNLFPFAISDPQVGAELSGFQTTCLVTVVDQMPAQEIQTSALVVWTPNAASAGQAMCIVTQLAAPVVY